MNLTTKVILTFLVIALGGGFLAFGSQDTVSYYVHVDELMKDPSHWTDKKALQVHGFSYDVPRQGTLQGDVLVREFNLTQKGKTIRVRHSGVVPDTFKESAETVVKGSFVQEGDKLVFVTIGGEQGIMAKCPSKYDAAR